MMNATADPSANFKLVIVQTELERFKFLVRSLLRARIAKVPGNMQVVLYASIC